MTNHQFYDSWISSIDLDKTKIQNHPKYLFLCGGPMSNNGGQFRSCRDVFYRHADENNWPLRDKILLAEKIYDYYKLSKYKDLFTFEKDIAGLSGLVILFSESAGSIAELGSFSVLKPVRSKLMVILSNNHAEKNSFIVRGPIEYLKKIDEDEERIHKPISVYDWETVNHGDTTKNQVDFRDSEQIAKEIVDIYNRMPSTKKINLNDGGHVMLLIMGLLKIIQIAKSGEINYIINKFGINQDRKTTEQQLSLLTVLKLINKKQYQHDKYYFPSYEQPTILWGYLTEARNKVEARWMTEFLFHYNETDEHKKKALKAFRRFHTQESQS